LFGCRGEEHIHSHLLGQPGVPLQVPGITLQVLGGPELGGIDEQAHHQPVADFTGIFHQAQVTLMKIPHGGHEGDAPALGGGR